MDGGAELLFGPMLIGVFANCILYGMMVVQTYIYFQRFKRDPRWFKMFVFYLLVFETLNVVCDTGVVYEPLIVRYGTPRAFLKLPILLSADSVVTVMISTPVQLFIAWRVKIMSESTVVPAIISFFAIVSFGAGIATSVLITTLGEYTLLHKCGPSAVIWLAASIAADVLITVSLVYNLLRQRTGFAATDNLINRIIIMTVQTGLITSLCALADVVLPALIRNSTANFAFDFALSKLYSNSLLSTLNARGGWKTTSSVKDNVLFGNGAGPESTGMTTTRRSQIEIVVVDTEAGRASRRIPMKVFDSGTYSNDHEGCPSSGRVNPTAKFSDDALIASSC